MTHEITNCGCSNVAVREGGETSNTQWTYRPNVDIVETDSAIEVRADLPGASSETIELAFEQGILSIDAPVARREQESWNRVSAEFGVGDFHRRFQIDAEVDAEQIAAEYVNGVLTVTLPKPSQAQRRRIAVKS